MIQRLQPDRSRVVDVRQGYDAWAVQYDDNRNRTRDLNAQVLREANLPLQGARVVEAGCGTGLNTPHLAASAAHVLATDFSEGMLERARRRVASEHVEFARADITRAWPADDESRDLVVITLVLEHVEHLDAVFTQAHRVLVDGGLLYISELHPYRQLAGGQARFTPDGSDGEVFVPAWKHSVSEYIETAIGAGFHVQRIAEPFAEGDELPRLLQLWLAADRHP